MLSIGELARRTDCSVPTIRFYESKGLLPRAARTRAGHRAYEAATIEVLHFIRRCRAFGMPIEDIRDLMPSVQKSGEPCDTARIVAQRQLDKLNAQLCDLKALRISLSRLIDSCTEQCRHGTIADCVLVNELRAPQVASSIIPAPQPRRREPSP